MVTSCEYKMNSTSISNVYSCFEFIKRHTKNEHDVINAVHCKTISRKSLNRLLTNDWLDDETINYMFQLFNIRSHILSNHFQDYHDWFMCSYFTSYLLGKGADEYNPDAVHKWLKRSPFPNLFTKYNRIFFPINFAKYHWMLVMADFSCNEIVSFDSLQGKKYPWMESPCDRILQFFTDYAQEIGYANFKPEIWKTYDARTSSKYRLSLQSDGISCGLYTIAHAELLSFKF